MLFYKKMNILKKPFNSPSYVNNAFIQKYYGYTLVEILVTLAIIGIVAALTIPSLFHRWERHSIEIGIKEAFQILNSSISASTSENGSLDDWNYNIDSEVFANQYIAPYIKHSGYFLLDKNIFNTDYSPRPMWQSYERPAALISTSSKVPVFRLDNGMLLLVSVYPDTSYYDNVYLHIDLNGKKGPNIVGNDIFMFVITKKTPTTRIFDTCSYYTNYGMECRWTLNDHLNGRTGCNSTGKNYTGGSGHSGESCTRFIQMHGWKIPDNYPVNY